MNQDLKQWVDSCAAHCQPDRVVWLDGSEEEIQRVYEDSVADGTFVKMNEET